MRNVGDTKRGTLAADMAAKGKSNRAESGMRHRGPARRASARRLASLLDGSEARGAVRPSGREWQGSQPGQSASELVFPRPMPWEMQYETAGPAGDASGQGEEAAPEGPGGHHPLVQADARGPAGQVMSHDLYCQPGSVGGEAPRGEMVESHAVLEVPDGVLDLGVAAMVGLQFQGVSLPVGDEGVIAVFGEQRQLGAGGGASPAGRRASPEWRRVQS